MSEEYLVKLIKKRWKEHKEKRDPEGFAICCIIDNFEHRVAPKSKWLGTEKEWHNALRDQAEMDKKVTCEFCSLCNELLKKFQGQDTQQEGEKKRWKPKFID